MKLVHDVLLLKVSEGVILHFERSYLIEDLNESVIEIPTSKTGRHVGKGWIVAMKNL
jgi:hypothetical protein